MTTTTDVPGLDEVTTGLWSLEMPLPGSPGIPHTLTYLIRDDERGVHVVDPGWDSDDNWALLLAALAAVASHPRSVRTVIATHEHSDHLGMADRLRRASGASLAMHPGHRDPPEEGSSDWAPASGRGTELLAVWGVPKLDRHDLEEWVSAGAARTPAVLDDELVDGELLAVPGFELRVMWTPGHTDTSICLRDDARGVILTGDHVLPAIHPGVGLGAETRTNPLIDYLASLDMVLRHPDHRALPGHGATIPAVGARAAEHAAHHGARAAQVAEVLAERHDATVWQVAERLAWTAGWQNLRGFFRYSALRQTAMHRHTLRQGASRTW